MKFFIYLAILTYYSHIHISYAFSDPELTWQKLESEHFEVIYYKKHFTLAKKALYYAEDAHQFLSKLLAWTPSAKTQIIIADYFDEHNGMATVLPQRYDPSGVVQLSDHGETSAWRDLLCGGCSSLCRCCL